MSQEQTSQIAVERREEKEFIANQNNNNSVCAPLGRGGWEAGSFPAMPLLSKNGKIKIGAQKFQPHPPPPPKKRKEKKKKNPASAITYLKKKS